MRKNEEFVFASSSVFETINIRQSALSLLRLAFGGTSRNSYSTSPLSIQTKVNERTSTASSFEQLRSYESNGETHVDNHMIGEALIEFGVANAIIANRVDQEDANDDNGVANAVKDQEEEKDVKYVSKLDRNKI